MKIYKKIFTQIVLIILLSLFNIINGYSQCVTSVATSQLNYTTSGGTEIVLVSVSSSSCVPTISDNRSWITTSFFRGKLFITVSSNSYEGRTGTVNIDGHSITINQEGILNIPGSISGATSTCSYESENYSISPVLGATSYTWVVPIGATITSDQGTQISVTFGVFSGDVKVKANNSSGSSPYRTLFVSVNSPNAYTVTGGGSYCSGGSGVAIGLSDTQTGVSYQLKLNGSTNIGSSVSGTGNAISFGNKTSAGAYTVVATNISLGCTKTMTGSATITVNSLPTAYPVTGGGSYCIGGSGVSVGLGDTQTGVNYQLKLNGSTNIGSPVSGTGNSISFGNKTSAGTYTVVAESSAGCTRIMTESAVITVNSLPTPYDVTGGGLYCSNDSGRIVGLSDSQLGFSYQLIRFTHDKGDPVVGTGSAIDFGYNDSGVYTVVSTNNSTGCTNTMTGSVTITEKALPTEYNLTGGGTYCSGGSEVTIGLDDTQTGDWYQLVLDGTTNIGSSIPGDEKAISFGNQTSVGTYTIVATSISTDCIATMLGSASINSLPTAYSVTGEDTLCGSGSGVVVGLSDTQTGVAYQLVLNEATNIGSAISGTGNTINFGNQTLEGTYTVVATNISTGCTSTMIGSVACSLLPDIPVSIVNDDRTGVGQVNLSAEPGTDNCVVKWYTATWDYLATGTTYSTLLSQSANYHVTTYNPLTGCESAETLVTATVNGVFQYEFNDANSKSKNYFRKIIPKMPVKSLAGIIYLDEEEVFEEVSYVDGIGRTLQTHSMGVTDIGKSVIQMYSYDSLGRQDTAFLPFVHESKGFYLDETRNIQKEFYNNSNDKIADDDSTFSTVEYETSPLSRVVEAGGVGENWQLSTGNTVKYNYETNTSTDAVIKWIYNSTNNNYTGLSNYEDYNLFKNTVIDLNGKSATTYTDKEGKTVLKDQAGLQTYYVYDVYGRLAHILPPEFVDKLAEVNDTVDTSYNLVKQYCYTYIYGERSLLVEKHLPGIEPIEYVYDKFNRPVMSRNGNLRANDQWSFIKYDKFGRTIQSGLWTDNGTVKKTRTELQVLLFNESDTYETYDPATGEYSDNVTPINGEIHTENYYDVYHPDAVAFDDLVMFDDSYTTNTKGFLTFTKVKILDGTNNYLTTTIYYNEKGQQIQAIKDNIFGKIDISAIKYNFMGQIEELKVEHTMPDNQIEAINKYYTYDAAGRLANVEQEIEADTTNGKVKMLEMEYNKLGQVTAKKLHNTVDEKFLQTIDYKYNIRGWLTHINDPGEQTNNDLFAMQLHYDDTIKTGSDVMNNGMISGIEWKIFDSKIETIKRAYAYTFDEHNRLIEADYYEGANLNQNVGRYDVDYTYTSNGKINTLKRNGKVNDNPNDFDYIDDLVYTYDGNQLKKVADASMDSLAINAFPDLDNLDTEYMYDDNGNMYSDANKGLTKITYNHLNLPDTVEFDSNNKIIFTYDAGGNKLEKQIIKNGNSDFHTFVGSFVYVNDTLTQIATEEGRVVLNDSTLTYDYEYFIKDHLGSVRVMFDKGANDSANIIQETHYYPYGMTIDGLSFTSTTNNKLFTGKEYNSEINLNWYDYGARNYDPQLGTWFNVDPMAEMYTSHSPYNYCLNDPVNNIDPNGMYVSMAPSSLYGGRGESKKRGSRGGGGGRGWSYNNGRDVNYVERDFGMGDSGSGYSTDVWDYFDKLWSHVDALTHTTTSSGNSYEELGYAALMTEEEYEQVVENGDIELYDLDPMGVWLEGGWEFVGYAYGRMILENSEINNITIFTPVALITGQAQSDGGMNGFNVAGDVIGGGAVVNGLTGFDAAINSTHTLKYAKGGVSAAELTAIKQAKALKLLNVSKSVGTKLGIAGGLVIAGDVLYNSEIKASHGINAAMTGIAFTGWGAPIAGLWFVADFGTGLITGTSISDRIDANTSSFDWDW